MAHEHNKQPSPAQAQAPSPNPPRPQHDFFLFLLWVSISYLSSCSFLEWLLGRLDLEFSIFGVQDQLNWWLVPAHMTVEDVGDRQSRGTYPPARI